MHSGSNPMLWYQPQLSASTCSMRLSSVLIAVIMRCAAMQSSEFWFAGSAMTQTSRLCRRKSSLKQHLAKPASQWSCHSLNNLCARAGALLVNSNKECSTLWFSAKRSSSANCHVQNAHCWLSGGDIPTYLCRQAVLDPEIPSQQTAAVDVVCSCEVDSLFTGMLCTHTRNILQYSNPP